MWFSALSIRSPLLRCRQMQPITDRKRGKMKFLEIVSKKSYNSHQKGI